MRPGGSPNPAVSWPSSLAASSRERSRASLTAARTRSCSSSTSFGSTASGLISTERICWWPLATAVTTPPPAVPTTSFWPSSSWIRAILACISCSCRIMFAFPAIAPIVRWRLSSPAAASVAGVIPAADIHHLGAKDLLGGLDQPLPCPPRMIGRGRSRGGAGAAVGWRRRARGGVDGALGNNLEAEAEGLAVDLGDGGFECLPVQGLLGLLAVNRPAAPDREHVARQRRGTRRARDQ